MGKAKHFCAGTYLEFKGKKECEQVGRKEWPYILGLTKNESNLTYLPGGTCENAPWETKEQTFLREFPEENGFLPVLYKEVYQCPITAKHTQFFYSITEVLDTKEKELGHLAVGKERVRKESDGQVLHVRWFGIKEFLTRIHPNHKKGCIAGLRDLASKNDKLLVFLRELGRDADQTFFMKNLELFDGLYA